MKTDKPFIKAFSFAGLFCAIIVVLLVKTHASNNLAYRIGFVVGHVSSLCFVPALIVGLIARQSKKSWSWVKVGMVMFIAIFISIVLQINGNGTAP